MSQIFEWKKEYELGIGEIDAQHKQLIKIISELYTAIDEQSAKKKLNNILEQLLDYANFHFSTEENYFKNFSYESAAEHIREHIVFTEKIIDQQKRAEYHETEVSLELIDFLKDWFVHHVLSSDRKYVSCFVEHGL